MWRLRCCKAAGVASSTAAASLFSPRHVTISTPRVHGTLAGHHRSYAGGRDCSHASSVSHCHEAGRRRRCRTAARSADCPDCARVHLCNSIPTHRLSRTTRSPYTCIVDLLPACLPVHVVHPQLHRSSHCHSLLSHLLVPFPLLLFFSADARRPRGGCSAGCLSRAWRQRAVLSLHLLSCPLHHRSHHPEMASARHTHTSLSPSLTPLPPLLLSLLFPPLPPPLCLPFRLLQRHS